MAGPIGPALSSDLNSYVLRAPFVYFLGHEPRDSLLDTYFLRHSCPLVYSGALRYIYGFFLSFCVLWITPIYKCIYLCVCVIFLTCVQDANLIYD
jgi:hypothetical protein